MPGDEQKGGGIPRDIRALSLRSAIGLVLVPLVLSLVAVGLATGRGLSDRRLAREEAVRVGSAWLTDLAGLVDPKGRAGLVEEAAGAMGLVSDPRTEAVVLAREYGDQAPLVLFLVRAASILATALVFLFAGGVIIARVRRGAVAGLDRRFKNLLDEPPAQRREERAGISAEVARLREALDDLAAELRDRGIVSMSELEMSTDSVDLRSELLQAVGVELYRPLDAVVSLSDRLLSGRDGELLESQADDVRVLRKAATRLREMVEEILDLSNILTDEFVLEYQRVNLSEIARDVAEVARGQLGERRITLEVRADVEQVIVAGNRRRLWQVVSNLVSNAIKFTDVGGVVMTVSRREDGAAQLVVEDSGVGIADMDQASVFDTFRQLAGAGRRGRGSGLGLAICRRIVELHKGKIGVSSVNRPGHRVHRGAPRLG